MPGTVIQARHICVKFAIMIIPPAEIMDMPLRPLIASLLLVASLNALAATEVLPLQHRTSAELLPTAQSFLGKDGTVSAFENKLIVNASPERIDDLRTLLQQLDTAPKRRLTFAGLYLLQAAFAVAGAILDDPGIAAVVLEVAVVVVDADQQALGRGVELLQHRTSAELLPTAQSFLGKDGTVSAFENKLIVNASPERIDDLRTLLQQLDTAPKRLLISVDNDDSNFQDNRGNARVIQYGTSNREGGLQQIQASEGQPALIQVGQSIPITSTSTDSYGRLQSDTEYRNVTQVSTLPRA